MHGGQGPEVVEWKPVPQTQWIVVPTVIVDVLLPLTASMNWVPPCEVTVTVRGPLGGGVCVGVRVADLVAVGPEGVGVRVAEVVTGGCGWSSAPTTKIGSVVALSMTAA